MNTQIGLKKIVTLVGLSMLLWTSVGCKKSNDNSVQIASRTRGTNAITNNTTTTVNGQQISSSSYVTTSNSYVTNFQAAVRELVSAQIDPSFVGTVSSTNGVIIRAYVEVDGNGNMVTSNSRVTLEIRDEYVGSATGSGGAIQPITMTLIGASGQAFNGQMQLVFRDSLGEVLIQGNFQNGGGAVQGQVYFANYKKWDGTSVSAPQYVALGNFTIATCGFFRC